MSVFDEPKIDAHCHVLDPARFAYAADAAYHPAGQELGPLAQYEQVMQAYGIRRALLVGPNSGYGTDNRCLLDALAQGQGRFNGIAFVPNHTSLAELRALQAQGVIGVALNATVLGVPYCLEAATLLRHAAELDLCVSMQAQGDQWVALLALLTQAGGPRLLIDHCGRPAPGGGVTQPGFQAVLALGQARRGSEHGYAKLAAVKLSGFQKFAAQPPPYPDAQPYLKALIEAYTLDACLWASDWPFLKAPQRLDVGPLLRQVERLLPDAADRRTLWWDSPRRWLGFNAA